MSSSATRSASVMVAVASWERGKMSGERVSAKAAVPMRATEGASASVAGRRVMAIFWRLWVRWW